MCQCKYTHEDLLFTQLCSDPASVHCNTCSGRMQSPLISAAVCKTGCQQACVSANTPMKIYGSCRCAVNRHFGTATLFSAESNHHCPVLLCKTGCHFCTATPFLAVMRSQQLRAAVQTRFTAGLWQCNFTYGGLLIKQVCSDPSPVHCNAVFGKSQSPLLRAAVQIRLTAGLCKCSYTYGALLIIQVCSDPLPVHCNTVWQKAIPTAQGCCTNQAHSRLWQFYL